MKLSKTAAEDRKKKTLRLPQKLINELDKLARQKGWTTTRLVTQILDEFVEWAKRK